MILPHELPVSNSNSLRIDIESPAVEVLDLRLVSARLRSLRAVASVRYHGQVVRGVCVVQHAGRLVVQMPESRSFGGVWESMIVLESPVLKAAINDAVIEAYKAAAIVGGLP